MSDPGSRLDDHVGQFRDVRRQLEEAILPLATSVDGRRFSFRVPLRGLELQPGGYVAIEDDGSTRLGPVLDVEVAHVDGPEVGREIGEAAEAFDVRSRAVLRLARGSGVVLDGQSGPFHDASVHAAPPDAVSAWIERVQPGGAALTVGELALVEGVPLSLAAGGFDRHIFLCGQAGSGKTYALGTILERLLLETTLRARQSAVATARSPDRQRGARRPQTQPPGSGPRALVYSLPQLGKADEVRVRVEHDDPSRTTSTGSRSARLSQRCPRTAAARSCCSSRVGSEPRSTTRQRGPDEPARRAGALVPGSPPASGRPRGLAASV